MKKLRNDRNNVPMLSYKFSSGKKLTPNQRKIKLINKENDVRKV